MNDSEALAEITDELHLPGDKLRRIAANFTEEMLLGLAGKKSSLKMLPSFLGQPQGLEKGEYLGLDFGGTNVRIMLVSFKGNGAYEVIRHIEFPLRDEKKGYDYTQASVSCEELFGFIARNLKRIIKRDRLYPLGHTFSFPCRSAGVNQATLITWTKEFETVGAEGRDIGALLEEALRCEQVNNVIPCAIINDTVGTLLAASYRDKGCDIATILGTGHNTSYLEQRNCWSKEPMIINIEAGNFNLLPLSGFDRLLDELSEKPREQILEKMVSGRYLGVLLKLILVGLNERGDFLPGVDLRHVLKEKDLTAQDISAVLTNAPDSLPYKGHLFCFGYGLMVKTTHDWQCLYKTCQALRNRSARLAAATYLGILRHIDPLLEKPHVIAVDGSLYEKMPGYAAVLQDALQELLAEKADRVKLKLVKDGSGVGAALAAAMAHNS